MHCLFLHLLLLKTPVNIAFPTVSLISITISSVFFVLYVNCEGTRKPSTRTGQWGGNYGQPCRWTQPFRIWYLNYGLGFFLNIQDVAWEIMIAEFINPRLPEYFFWWMQLARFPTVVSYSEKRRPQEIMIVVFINIGLPGYLFWWIQRPWFLAGVSHKGNMAFYVGHGKSIEKITDKRV